MTSGGSYDASEGQLATEWERAKGLSRLTWPEAKQATQAAWNRLESNSTRTDPLAVSRAGERHEPLNPPPLSRGAFQRVTHVPENSIANSVAANTGHLSDTAHQAWEQTTDRAAVPGNGTYASTSDRRHSKAMDTVREVVRSRPLAAIGIAMAIGFVLVCGSSSSRAISHGRRF
jgi:ElaB/YqjD/DUF883 family membrane-anchored ribosome-binding protein